MNCAAAACLLLLPGPFSHAQKTVGTADSAKSEIHSQPCINCSTAVAPSPEQNGAEPTVPNSELPDAPSSTTLARQDTFVWSLTEPTKQPNPAPPPVPIWDKKMWAANIFLAGATIFDVESTHQGLAHHMCVEGNSDLNNKPSRGELYLDNLEQFAPVVVMGGLTALSGRAAHLPVWAWKALRYIGPIYGSTIHLRGGIRWYTRCW